MFLTPSLWPGSALRTAAGRSESVHRVSNRPLPERAPVPFSSSARKKKACEQYIRVQCDSRGTAETQTTVEQLRYVAGACCQLFACWTCSKLCKHTSLLPGDSLCCCFSARIPTAEARACLRLALLPCGRGQAVVVSAVAEGSSAAQVVTESVAKTTHVSAPSHRHVAHTIATC